MADFCYLHGRIPATGCWRCDQRRYNEADNDGEALSVFVPSSFVDRTCEVCLRLVDFGSRCPRCEDDEAPF